MFSFAANPAYCNFVVTVNSNSAIRDLCIGTYFGQLTAVPGVTLSPRLSCYPHVLRNNNNNRFPITVCEKC